MTPSEATSTKFPKSMHYDQIILFGDSITENSFETNGGFCYGAALSHAYKRRLDVVNRGFSGYNTTQALAVLPKFMPSPDQAHVRLFIVFFGANDSCHAGDPTGRHVPVATFKENLASIINHSTVQAHQPAVLVVTTSPIDERQRIVADKENGFGAVLRRSAIHTAKYAAACEDTAAVLGCPVVDMWTSFARHVGWKDDDGIMGDQDAKRSLALQSLFTDGLHLTSTGYEILFKEVMASIKANYPALDPEKIEYCYPPWDKQVHS